MAWNWKRCLMSPGLIVCLGLAGCGHKEQPAEIQTAEAAPSAPVKPSDPRLCQPFADATIQDPPPRWQRPPDTTMAGKSVGKMYTDVLRLWDEIRFENPQGKRLDYRAVLETELGNVTISLWPDRAPNHVRSFVALARAGYYDGLVFERTVRQFLPDQPDTKMELIEAGCPKGTGELGYGSIGYWLKPEYDAKAQHEIGTVGATHAAEEDTSACKFYINLCKAPYMDGNFTAFGKVIDGLGVASDILVKPVLEDDEFPDQDRPVKPVVIRKVTIESSLAAD